MNNKLENKKEKNDELIGQERRWTRDTNYERFRIEKLNKIIEDVSYYKICYFTTDGRFQVQDKETILNKSILLEPLEEE